MISVILILVEAVYQQFCQAQNKVLLDYEDIHVLTTGWVTQFPTLL